MLNTCKSSGVTFNTEHFSDAQRHAEITLMFIYSIILHHALISANTYNMKEVLSVEGNLAADG